MKPLIVANWKMNPKTLVEARRLFNSVKKGIKNVKNVELVICPPFLYLSFFKSQTSVIKLGAQDCFWVEKGAFTGEVSPSMLKNLGCQYIILGHSERRRYFNETDEMINKKIKAAMTAKLKPILCVGENWQEKQEEKTPQILKEQILVALKNISKFQIKNTKLIIAYEPIWAIGSGRPCDTDAAQTVGLLIRNIVAKLYNRQIAKNIQVIYGGSVNSKNAAGYIKEAGLQGLLIGGASLDPKEFVELVKKVGKA